MVLFFHHPITNNERQLVRLQLPRSLQSTVRYTNLAEKPQSFDPCLVEHKVELGVAQTLVCKLAYHRLWSPYC